MINLKWIGSPREISFDIQGMSDKLKNMAIPCYVVKDLSGRIGITNTGTIRSEGKGLFLKAIVPAFTAEDLGDTSFKEDYQLKYAYKAGAMANGIASTDMVIALGQHQMMGSFGAAGMIPSRVKEAIATIQTALPTQAYACNLIHSPIEKALEEGAVNLYIEHGVRVVEASAYMNLSEQIVKYRAVGLSLDAQGEIVIGNKVIGKVSRKEVAQRFMSPAPLQFLDKLLAAGKITQQQYELAQKVPMADDITVEADSGGHTDNRPLVVLFPIILQLRDELQATYNYKKQIRVGAAGGIGTPASALAAFSMGAAYLVTGSINQACVESGTSDTVKELLSKVASTDVTMAPASDMFELGVELQVLKRGTLFGARAKKLYEIYTRYDGIDDIPAEERLKLETKTFKMPLEQVWEGCIRFFEERDPEQIEKAKGNPKRKMALIFRWYLGLSSNWANAGVPDRVMDYQIWCGPAMGAFNEWTKESYLSEAKNRKVADVATHLLEGAAYLHRINTIKDQGVDLPLELLSLEVEDKHSVMI
jgi:PfaD family protein